MNGAGSPGSRCSLVLLGMSALGAVWVNSAHGQASPLSQERSVSICAFADFASPSCTPDQNCASATAPGFDHWNVNLEVMAASCAGPIFGYGVQDSSMTPTEIRATGELAFDLVGNYPTSLSIAGANGTFRFRHSFRLRTATPYTLAGTYQSVATGEVLLASVELLGSDGPIFEWFQYQGPEFTHSGELAPETYTVSAAMNLAFNSFEHGHHPHSGEVAIDMVLALTPPACPCDWDGDSMVGSMDFFVFLNDFFAGDADFNSDGVTNSQDFFDFLWCFFAPPGGCT